jgi:hypothetical protein
MHPKLFAVAMIAALLSFFVVAPFSAEAARPTGTATASFQGIAGTVTNLDAAFDPATGVTTITGTFTDTAGNITNSTMTLLDGSGSCQILHLVLGPLDLNILGLMVHLNQVVLDITAQTGPGNLLGNLLCAIAGLLDSNSLGSLLANLLNQLFNLLA